jgi:hypothetical protein
MCFVIAEMVSMPIKNIIALVGNSMKNRDSNVTVRGLKAAGNT